MTKEVEPTSNEVIKWIRQTQTPFRRALREVAEDEWRSGPYAQYYLWLYKGQELRDFITKTKLQRRSFNLVNGRLVFDGNLFCMASSAAYAEALAEVYPTLLVSHIDMFSPDHHNILWLGFEDNPYIFDPTFGQIAQSSFRFLTVPFSRLYQYYTPRLKYERVDRKLRIFKNLVRGRSQDYLNPRLVDDRLLFSDINPERNDKFDMHTKEGVVTIHDYLVRAILDATNRV